MPMPAASTSMPMPSYARMCSAMYFLKAKLEFHEAKLFI
jgi:hypothetical protein